MPVIMREERGPIEQVLGVACVWMVPAHTHPHVELSFTPVRDKENARSPRVRSMQASPGLLLSLSVSRTGCIYIWEGGI